MGCNCGNRKVTSMRRAVVSASPRILQQANINSKTPVPEDPLVTQRKVLEKKRRDQILNALKKP